MEIRPLAELLEDLLLTADEGGAEIQLAQAVSAENDDFLVLREEYEQRYARAVAGVRELRGEPTFAGSAGEHGFPSGLRGEHASCWVGPHGMIYLALDAGPGSFVLVGGARAARSGRRDQPTLQPPPS
ncbi:MAG: hypothetical protein QM778_32045 [Myxococcales bacterium]